MCQLHSDSFASKFDSGYLGTNRQLLYAVTGSHRKLIIKANHNFDPSLTLISDLKNFKNRHPLKGGGFIFAHWQFINFQSADRRYLAGIDSFRFCKI
jgi:hypothetical protein